MFYITSISSKRYLNPSTVSLDLHHATCLRDAALIKLKKRFLSPSISGPDDEAGDEKADLASQCLELRLQGFRTSRCMFSYSPLLKSEGLAVSIAATGSRERISIRVVVGHCS